MPKDDADFAAQAHSSALPARHDGIRCAGRLNGGHIAPDSDQGKRAPCENKCITRIEPAQERFFNGAEIATVLQADLHALVTVDGADIEPVQHRHAPRNDVVLVFDAVNFPVLIISLQRGSAGGQESDAPFPLFPRHRCEGEGSLHFTVHLFRIKSFPAGKRNQVLQQHIKGTYHRNLRFHGFAFHAVAQGSGFY